MAAEADAVAGTGHAVTTGRQRELIVHKFLRQNLPQTLEIRSGIIIDSEGNRSKQQDCIIVDNTHPIIAIGTESEALVIAESVVATVEVKSHLSVAELTSTLNSIAITKGLKRNGEQLYRKGGIEIRFPKPHPILAYVFSFDGANLDTLLNEMARFAFEKNDGGIVPEAVCVLNKGVILRASLMPTIDNTKHEARLPQTEGVDVILKPLIKDALLAFYSRLKDDVIPLRMINYNIDPYYASDELE